MKTKFTKGEWRVDMSEDWTVSVVSPWSKDVTTDNFSTFADYRGALICEMRYNTGVPTKETAEANAKLIAAAPEMFEILVRVLADIERDTLTNNTKIMIEQAIKKATE